MLRSPVRAAVKRTPINRAVSSGSLCALIWNLAAATRLTCAVVNSRSIGSFSQVRASIVNEWRTSTCAQAVRIYHPPAACTWVGTAEIPLRRIRRRGFAEALCVQCPKGHAHQDERDCCNTCASGCDVILHRCLLYPIYVLLFSPIECCCLRRLTRMTYAGKRNRALRNTVSTSTLPVFGFCF